MTETLRRDADGNYLSSSGRFRVTVASNRKGFGCYLVEDRSTVTTQLTRTLRGARWWIEERIKARDAQIWKDF